MDVAIKIASFLVVLGILVTFHELGHYLVARWCGVKVLRFSVGFGRVLWRRQKHPGATEFVICALPFGGYVRMLDEGEGPVAAHELERGFNRRPLLQRTAVVAAGPLANLLWRCCCMSAAYTVPPPGYPSHCHREVQDHNAD